MSARRVGTMRARAGMTLLELTVALAVGGAAVAAGGGAVALLLDRREAIIADADVDGRALAARRQLVSWVSGVRADQIGTFDGRQGDRRTAVGEIADDTISFVTFSAGELQRVQLFVDRSADRPALVAEVESARDSLARIELAPGVTGFEVSYLTSAFGKREWRRTWNGSLLPTAIVIKLRAAEGSELPAALRVPVTIPLGNSQ